MADVAEPSALATFTPVDYVVLSCVLLISVIIGIYHAFSGGKQKTTSDFLLADRTVHPVVAGLSLVASFISGITLLGTPGENYIYGSMYWLYGFALSLCGLIACCFFVPVFMQLDIKSVNEYLELRFNRTVRMCGLVVFLIYTLLYLGMVLYAPALALSAVAGISLWGSILTTGLVCTFYTTIGGMRAVVWTDVFQVSVMMAAILSVIIEGCRRLGGLKNMWHIAEEGERIHFWDFRLDPTIRHTFWSITIGGAVTWCTSYCINQTQLQRCLACGSLKKAEIAMAFSIVGMVIVVSLTSLCGLTMYAFYVGCDPLERKLVDKSDQLMVFFILDLFEHAPGLPGFFTSGVFSAALSSLSSALNALVVVTVEDFVKHFWKDMSDSQLTTLSKGLVSMYGLIVIILAYIVSLLTTKILQLALGLMGILGGPLLGLFSLGIFFPWANSKGAICGLAVAIFLTCWIGIGAIIYPPDVYEPPLSADKCMNASLDITTTAAVSTYPQNINDHQAPFQKLYSISYAWYAVVGWCSTVIVGLAVSFLTGPTKSSDIGAGLVCSFVETTCSCCPKSCKIRFQYGASNNYSGYIQRADELYSLQLEEEGAGYESIDGR